MTESFTDNAAEGRFEYRMNGEVAFAKYRRSGGVLYIDYVEAPAALRGTGAAGKLMSAIMQLAKESGVKVIPVCGYAASWISKHPEYAHV